MNADTHGPFAYGIDVRFRDCDAMGHVNNAVYFTYMEQARFEYARYVLGDDLSGLALQRELS